MSIPVPPFFFLSQEEFGDTKGVIRIRKSPTKWPKEKVQKDKQRSTKHTHKTKDRVTRIALKTGGGAQVIRKDRQFLIH
jgi:hypothetical protein